jgi:hypothetical protein
MDFGKGVHGYWTFVSRKLQREYTPIGRGVTHGFWKVRKGACALLGADLRVGCCASSGYLEIGWPRIQSMTHIDRRIEWRHCGIYQVHRRVRRSRTDIGSPLDPRAI